jgi:hypothetical protein
MRDPLPSVTAMRSAGDTGAGTDTDSAAGPVEFEAADRLRLLSSDTSGASRSMDYFSGAAGGDTATTRASTGCVWTRGHVDT